MAYGNFEYGSKGFFFRLKLKICRWLAASFPLNSIRVNALRCCGFKIGNKIYIGPSFMLATMNTEDTCKLEIRDRVSIGPRVTIVLASDPNWSRLNKIYKPIRSSVVLKKDCWLGAGCIIMPGITIGECSIVGAGTVVTEDVPPYTIVAGVPAKIIRTIDKEGI
jgi:acetyltransferase-like isoleucine patch superfamily enzyme